MLDQQFQCEHGLSSGKCHKNGSQVDKIFKQIAVRYKKTTILFKKRSEFYKKYPQLLTNKIWKYKKKLIRTYLESNYNTTI